MVSWRLILHIAACLDWDIQQIDVKTAFLYGLLPEDETQYMKQPEGFEEPGKEDWVWQLERGLDGMKQAGRVSGTTCSMSPCYHGVSPAFSLKAAFTIGDAQQESSSPLYMWMTSSQCRAQKKKTMPSKTK